jgi:hypothetical protein
MLPDKYGNIPSNSLTGKKMTTSRVIDPRVLHSSLNDWPHRGSEPGLSIFLWTGINELAMDGIQAIHSLTLG